MKARTDQFHKLVSEALQDESLQKALARANTSFQDARGEAVDSMPDWQELRQQGHEIKKRAIDNLPEALETFEKNISSRGVEVHYCEDGASARDTILSIIRSHDGASVTKSKSMVTEEIALNDHLEAAGLSVLEGDLGEYIIQLAGEHPSHIIAPAIHKSREEVAELFHEHLGSDPQLCCRRRSGALRPLRSGHPGPCHPHQAAAADRGRARGRRPRLAGLRNR